MLESSEDETEEDDDEEEEARIGVGQASESPIRSRASISHDPTEGPLTEQQQVFSLGDFTFWTLDGYMVRHVVMRTTPTRFAVSNSRCTNHRI